MLAPWGLFLKSVNEGEDQLELSLGAFSDSLTWAENAASTTSVSGDQVSILDVCLATVRDATIPDQVRSTINTDASALDESSAPSRTDGLGLAEAGIGARADGLTVSDIEAGASTGLLPPEESALAQRGDGGTPVDAIATQVADGSNLLERGTGVRADVPISSEAAGGARGDGLAPDESAGNAKTDGATPTEVAIGVRGDSSTPAEGSVMARADSIAPSEAAAAASAGELTIIDITAPRSNDGRTPAEYGLSVTSFGDGPVTEFGAAQQASAVAPGESATIKQTDVGIAIELALGILSDSAVLTEQKGGQASVTTDAILPIQIIGTESVDEAGSIERALSAYVDIASIPEMALDAVGDASIQEDQKAQPSGDGLAPTESVTPRLGETVGAEEFGEAALSDSGDLVETLAAEVIDDVALLKSGLVIFSDRANPVEFAAGSLSVVLDAVLPTEWELGVRIDIGSSADYVRPFALDMRAGVDFLLLRAAEAVVPAEYLARQLADRTVPADWLAVLLMDAELPTELQSVAVLRLLSAARGALENLSAHLAIPPSALIERLLLPTLQNTAAQTDRFRTARLPSPSSPIVRRPRFIIRFDAEKK